MSTIGLHLLGEKEKNLIHQSSLAILEKIGILVPDREISELLQENKAQKKGDRLLLPSSLVEESIAKAGKSFSVYGRDGERSVHFALGKTIFCSSPGQFAWFEGAKRREPQRQDFLQAIHVAHHLAHIDLLGGLAMPLDIPPSFRELYMVKELFTYTDKPIFVWFSEPQHFRSAFEMSVILTGNQREAVEKPRFFAFLEPISPLRFPQKGLAILKEATTLGLPVMIGPMAQSGATAPVTLAGTLAQENAEILASITITQLLSPGTPICYGGIPHIADPRTGSISFGSPEQALLSLAMAEIGATLYHFPVYINTGLTDSLALDPQNGWEKGITLILGMLAGATTFGHMGIVGCDQGGSITQLVLDNELISFCKRIVHGIEVNQDTLAIDEIASGVQEGTFLVLPHTVRFFRRELWLPELSTRGTFREEDVSLIERAKTRVENLLASPLPLLPETKRKELETYFIEITGAFELLNQNPEVL